MEWLIGKLRGRWEVLDGEGGMLTASEMQRVVEKWRLDRALEALAFMRSCEASGEKGADHPIVLHALDPERYQSNF